MATTEERMKILNMIREGKITAEEGAKLLSALGESQKAARSTGTRASREPRWFRVWGIGDWLRLVEALSGCSPLEHLGAADWSPDRLDLATFRCRSIAVLAGALRCRYH